MLFSKNSITVDKKMSMEYRFFRDKKIKNGNRANENKVTSRKKRMKNVKAVILAAGEGTRGFRVEALRVDDPTIVFGVNTKEDLERVIQIMENKNILNQRRKEQ